MGEAADVHAGLFERELPTLLRDFRLTAQASLARIAESLGVTCSEGRYGDVFTAARKARVGVVQDEAGQLRYRFHGSGCEVRLDGAEVDFGWHFNHGAASPILIGAFGIVRYARSRGFDVDEASVHLALDRAVQSGLLTRVVAGRAYYSIPGGTP
ncbi:MAG: hypothetical protein V4850_14285 [Myxococcota bacterium]